MPSALCDSCVRRQAPLADSWLRIPTSAQIDRCLGAFARKEARIGVALVDCDMHCTAVPRPACLQAMPASSGRRAGRAMRTGTRRGGQCVPHRGDAQAPSCPRAHVPRRVLAHVRDAAPQSPLVERGALAAWAGALRAGGRAALRAGGAQSRSRSEQAALRSRLKQAALQVRAGVAQSWRRTYPFNSVRGRRGRAASARRPTTTRTAC